MTVEDQVPDGAEVGWSFLSFAFRTGDVILCTNPFSPKSWGIRLGTRKDGITPRFSHAAVCVDGPLFIDASYPSVAKLHIDRVGNVRSLNSVRVLRLKDAVPNSTTYAQRAAAAAIEFEGVGFSALKAVESAIPGWTPRMGRRAFCSYVVAAAYLKAGINLTADFGTPQSNGKIPSRTSPADIERSGWLKDVTGEVTVKSIFLPGAAPREWIDRSLSISPARRINSKYQRIANRASSFLKARNKDGVDEFSDLIQAMRTYRNELWFAELDDFVALELGNFIVPLIMAIQSPDADERTRRRGILSLQFDKASPTALSIEISTILNQLWIKQKLIREGETTYQLLRRDAEHSKCKTSASRADIEKHISFVTFCDLTQLYGDLLAYRTIAANRQLDSLVRFIDDMLKKLHIQPQRLG